ncbi:MAG: hypothetical protein HY515_02220 [Candidatus Aenigmarchaeota archaeon]|nr:hypothetical protein [Candidatus Aenigmarchaeota archaeon]
MKTDQNEKALHNYGRPGALAVGQQRIAVMPAAQNYPALDVQPEWADSLVWDPQSATALRVRHDYRRQEDAYERANSPDVVAEAGPFRLVRLEHHGRYRQGV